MKHVVTLLAVPLLLAACKPKPEASAARPAAPPVSVQLAAAVQRNVPVELTAFGTVQPRETAVIKPQVGGLLERALFTEGQELRKGDPLFVIDPRPFDAALAAAEARIQQAQVEGGNARRELDRLKELAARGIAAQDVLDAATTRVEAAAAALRAAEAARDSAQIERGYCEIRSPISGVAGAEAGTFEMARLLEFGNGEVIVYIDNVVVILIPDRTRR